MNFFLKWLFSVIFSSKSSKNLKKAAPVKAVEPEVQFVGITLSDLLTSSGKYPDRESSQHLTEEMKKDGKELIGRVNGLLRDLGINKVRVSSGYRTPEVNAGIPNAARKSLHMSCKAVDLLDPKGEIDKAVQGHPELLVKHGLWLEHPDHTTGWCHLDMSTTRWDRPIRIFNP